MDKCKQDIARWHQQFVVGDRVTFGGTVVGRVVRVLRTRCMLSWTSPYNGDTILQAHWSQFLKKVKV